MHHSLRYDRREGPRQAPPGQVTDDGRPPPLTPAQVDAEGRTFDRTTKRLAARLGWALWLGIPVAAACFWEACR